MNNDGDDKKLDWMYKGANSLVDREEYLLGRSVDTSLEQLNIEEKEKKLGLAPPKNHVEHECIPPSIRDFNKIVQAEQVDISAKLQEDPLVAIKKREEEARRQFLQNPVQLKKLQEALKAQELKRKKKHKKAKGSDSDSDIDSRIVKKLKYLKDDRLEINVSNKNKHKSKENILDTILMHKFNQLKDKLSQEDLNDILAGNASDNNEEEEHKLKKHKRQNIESSEDEQTKFKKKESRDRSRSREDFKKSLKKTSKDYNDVSETEKFRYKSKRGDENEYRNEGREKSEKYRKTKFNEDMRRTKKTRKSSSSNETSEDDTYKKLKYIKRDNKNNHTNRSREKSIEKDRKFKRSEELRKSTKTSTRSSSSDNEYEKSYKQKYVNQDTKVRDNEDTYKKFEKSSKGSRSNDSSEDEKYDRYNYKKRDDRNYLPNDSREKCVEEYQQIKHNGSSYKQFKMRNNRSSSNDSSEDEKYNKNKHTKRYNKNRDKSDHRHHREGDEKYVKTKHNEEYRSTNRNEGKYGGKYTSSEDESEDEIKKGNGDKYKTMKKKKVDESVIKNIKKPGANENQILCSEKHKHEPDSDLESKILKKLRMLRDSAKSKASECSSSSTDSESNHEKKENKPKKDIMERNQYKQKGRTNNSSSDDSDSGESHPQKIFRHYDSDNEEHVYKPRTFGLVKSDGTKISLSKNSHDIKKAEKPAKLETISKPERKKVKQLTEDEKDKLRREMMKNAEKRDKERSENLRKYREEGKREEINSADFDKEFVHKQLLKTTKDATVETRIKSKLNYIQRSSKHMDSHFSRRN